MGRQPARSSKEPRGALSAAEIVGTVKRLRTVLQLKTMSFFVDILSCDVGPGLRHALDSAAFPFLGQCEAQERYEVVAIVDFHAPSA